MRKIEISTVAVVARNLKALMERHGLKQKPLAKLSGVSQRHISSILAGQAEAGIEKLDKLAKPFKLQGWQLQMPNLPIDLLDSDIIGTVVEALMDANAEGRDLIKKQAVREAHYNKGER